MDGHCVFARRIQKQTLSLLRTAALAASLSPAITALGVTTTFTNANNNLLWGDPGNWTNGVPTASDTALFANSFGSVTVDLGGVVRRAAVVRLNAAGYTLSNGTLSTSNFDALSAATINTAVTGLGASLLVQGPTPAGLVVNGPIFGAIDLEAKAVLAATNTYAGRTRALGVLNLSGIGSAATSSRFIVPASKLQLDYTAPAGDVNKIGDEAPITLWRSTLELNNSSSAQVNESVGTITLLKSANAGAISGTFNNLPQNSIFFADGQAFQINYPGGDGNDVVLTAVVPEPASIGILTASGALLLSMGRRRRRDRWARCSANHARVALDGLTRARPEIPFFAERCSMKPRKLWVRSMCASMMFAAAAAITSTAQARADETIWMNFTGNGLWGDASNWTNGVPDATKIAIIDDGGTITLGGVTRVANRLMLVQAGILVNGHLSTNRVSGDSGDVYASVGAIGGVLDLSRTALVRYEGGIGDGNAGGDFSVIGYGVMLAPATHSGATIVRNMTLGLGGQITRSSSIDITLGELNIQNNQSSPPPPPQTNFLPDSAPIRFRNGIFVFTGPSANSSTEKVGAIELLQGGAAFSIASQGLPDPENPITQTIIADSLHREPLTTLRLSVPRVDNAAKLRLLETPLMSGGGVGAMQRPVLGYSTGPFLYRQSFGIASAWSFATYDAGPTSSPEDDVGLRMLDTRTEYATSMLPGASLNNVRLTQSQALSADSSVNALVIDGGHVTLDNNAALTMSSGGLLLAGQGSYTAVSGSGRLLFPDEALIACQVLPGSRATIDVPIQANALVYYGSGAAILNRPSSYTGGTHIQGGLLGVGTQGAIGDGSIEMTGGGGLLFTGSSQSYANPVLIGTPDTSGAAQPPTYSTEFVVDAGIEGTLSAPIPSYATRFTKHGGGLLRFGSDYNAKVGGEVEIAEGTLVINGTARSNLSQLPLTVFGDGTLAGNGTILGTVRGGNISPGDGIGRLTIQKLFSTTSNFLFELHGAGAGVGYDQLVTLQPIETAANLLLFCDFAPAFGNTFLIMDDQFSGAFNGFVGIPQNAIVTASNGAQFKVSYIAGDGNDVLLTAVPEPASIGILIGSGALLLSTGRLRRRDCWTVVRGGWSASCRALRRFATPSSAD